MDGRPLRLEGVLAPLAEAMASDAAALALGRKTGEPSQERSFSYAIVEDVAPPR